MSEAWTVDSAPYSNPSRNPSMSAVGTNATNINGNWAADQLYNNGYSMAQSDDGKTWYNPRYGDVGMPAPPIPSQPYYHGGYQNDSRNAPYQTPMTGRISSRYEPGCALSIITEKSTPQTEKSPLANTPASYQSELDYYTAQGSEASQSVYRQQQSHGGGSPHTQGYPSSRRKPVEYRPAGNWI